MIIMVEGNMFSVRLVRVSEFVYKTYSMNYSTEVMCA